MIRRFLLEFLAALLGLSGLAAALVALKYLAY